MSDVLEAKDLVKQYGSETALGGVDFAVAAGEIHALVGLNGAGKSTLMKSLMGMVAPTSGAVRVLGREVQDAGPGEWGRVGHMIETPLAYPELTVEENLHLVATLRLVPGPEVAARVDTLVESLDLGHWRRRRASTLSLGNRQRLSIACALVGHPDALVLDEPTSALDPRGVLLVREVLEQIRSRGCGVLISSHHLDEVARVADRITVIHQGVIVGALAPEGVDLEREFFDMVYAHDLAAAS